MTGLTKNAKILMVIYTLHSVIELFIHTFLVAYFLSLSGNNIIPSALFYIFAYFVSSLCFVFLGPIIKKDRNFSIFRISFIVNALLFLAIIYLKQQCVPFIWILGVILGLEKVLFYFPQNLLTAQFAKGKALITFNGYRYGWKGLVTIVMPVVFGWFISVDSFINTACFVVLLTFAEFVFSYLLDDTQSQTKSFRLGAFTALALKRSTIKLAIITDFIRGLSVYSLDLLIVMYIVYLFKTNLNLGIITSVFSACTVLITFIFGKFCRFKSFMPILSFCSLLTFIVATYFVFETSKSSFIAYNLIYATALQLVFLICDINFYQVSQNKSVTLNYRAEFITLRELFLNSGRVIGFGLIIIAALAQNQNMLKYLILTLSSLLLIMGFMSVSLSNRLRLKQL